jgi:hypothetical protein
LGASSALGASSLGAASCLGASLGVSAGFASATDDGIAGVGLLASSLAEVAAGAAELGMTMLSAGFSLTLGGATWVGMAGAAGAAGFVGCAATVVVFCIPVGFAAPSTNIKLSVTLGAGG